MEDSDGALARSIACIGFLENRHKRRAEIRELSKSANKDLLTAHQFAFSGIISYQSRVQGKKYEASKASTKGQMSLVAQFIQGIDLTETAISEGLYACAANLLKQELEALAAFDEYSMSDRRDGKTPNFSRVLSNFRRTYGDLNEIAHPTRQEIVERLSTFSEGDKYGPTTIPQFNSSLYQVQYGNHAMLMIMLFGRMATLFKEVLNLAPEEDEERLVVSSLRILIQEGTGRVGSGAV